ncbi:MAG TPA: hypothetical protein VGF45_08050 [Polyangia bacterium]|jgi:hypothetical protein
MDPRVPPVTVEVNGTAAQLLVKLMHDMETADPMAVLSRALGILETALVAKKQGRRLGLYDPVGQRFVDLVI